MGAKIDLLVIKEEQQQKALRVERRSDKKMQSLDFGNTNHITADVSGSCGCDEFVMKLQPRDPVLEFMPHVFSDPAAQLSTSTPEYTIVKVMTGAVGSLGAGNVDGGGNAVLESSELATLTKSSVNLFPDWESRPNGGKEMQSQTVQLNTPKQRLQVDQVCN